MSRTMESTIAATVDAVADEYAQAQQEPAPELEDNCLEDTLLMPAQQSLQLVDLPTMLPLLGPKAMSDWPASSDLRPPIV